MRSEEERDHCIDILVKKVENLEQEVAKLKGITQVQQSTQPHKTVSQDSPGGIFIPEPEQKKDVVKPAQASLESVIGTRWIGRIGILAILFGVAFFADTRYQNT